MNFTIHDPNFVNFPKQPNLSNTGTLALYCQKLNFLEISWFLQKNLWKIWNSSKKFFKTANFSDRESRTLSTDFHRSCADWIEVLRSHNISNFATSLSGTSTTYVRMYVRVRVGSPRVKFKQRGVPREIKAHLSRPYRNFCAWKFNFNAGLCIGHARFNRLYPSTVVRFVVRHVPVSIRSSFLRLPRKSRVKLHFISLSKRQTLPGETHFHTHTYTYKSEYTARAER